VRPVGAARAVVLSHVDPPAYQPGSVVMLTSGTSGMASGCVHRADALARNAARHAAAVGLRAGDTVLVTLPLHYSYAIVAQALAALVTGQRLVISGPPFAPAAYREVIGRHGVTVSSVTPTIARLLLADPRPLPAGLRTLTVGGDRLAATHVGALLATNPGLELYLTYGLTEAGPRVATLAAHAEPAHRHASAGLPLPGVRTALRPVPGRPGATELLVTSDTVLLRRVGRPGPDRTLVGPDTVATGDLFRADADGYLYHEGRLSDFAILRGEKVCLAAVRQLVETVPGVVRCATVIADDASHFDLDVRVTATGAPASDEVDLAAAEQRVRAAVAAYLLPGERPRRITVGPPNLAAFHK
jgi:acyl-CoA synthetase (AMP-forming)/AMP-acid ligase II